MRLFEEILSAAGFDEELAGGAKVVLFAGKCGYFENVKSISAFSDTEVSLLLSR